MAFGQERNLHLGINFGKPSVASSIYRLRKASLILGWCENEALRPDMRLVDRLSDMYVIPSAATALELLLEKQS
jgi:hypothetical protein